MYSSTLYSVEVKTGMLSTNMYVYKLSDDNLLVVNPQVVNDAVLDEILKLGRPSVFYIHIFFVNLLDLFNSLL
jgi:hypothetical protein